MPYLIMCLVMVACFGFGYHKGEKDGENSIVATQAKIDDTLSNKFQEQQNAITKSIENIHVVNTTIVKQATHDIRENPVYINCHNAPDVLRDINAAILNHADQSTIDTAKSKPTSMSSIDATK